MKLIIGVTFFGILTCAFASYRPYISEKCLDVKPMVNFDPTKFFSGIWYVTQAKNGTVATVCHKYNTGKEDSGSYFFYYGYYNNAKEDPFFKVRCRQTGNKENGKFAFHCQVVEGQQVSKFQEYNVDITFIDTDYNDYAIFYRCVPIGSGFADNFLVLHRNMNANSDIAKKILKDKQNVDLVGSFDRKNSKCKENPNF
uniref:Putative salivary lipocalin n=1 Tax=Triatoma infestans TaxID=30076 RepID=A0A023FAQ9_TRIIF